MIRCCVFDLDGTLLNTTYALQRSMNLTLAEFGFGEISLAQVKQYVGNGSLNYCRRALDYFGADKEALLEPVSRRYAELFQQHCGYRVEPYEGMREALAFLRSRGAKLAVLSNKPQARTEDNIYSVFGRELFDHVQGERPGIPLKPDPSSLLTLLRDLKAEPEECLYFGDTGTDMETGTRAGVHTIGVLRGFRERPELEQFHPEAVLDSPAGIPEIYLRKVNS
ncbi:MAG: HAD family hydrolase [Stomatobaculum sp.]|nr:HAD family hydrolase [Stomatobaculum sp.]